MHIGDKCVFKHTGKAGDDKNGNATFAIQLAIELCLERRPRIYVLSAIDSEENRMATNIETLQSAILSQYEKTLPYERKKKPSLGVF